MNEAKPPVGLVPRLIWEETMNENRIDNILWAIGRYAVARRAIPVEWADELRERIFLGRRFFEQNKGHKTKAQDVGHFYNDDSEG